MRIKIDQSNLASALSSVSRLTPRRAVHPVLTCTLIEAVTSRVVLSSTDLEMYMRIGVPAKVNEEGSALVNAKTLTDLVRRLDGDLTIDADDATATISYSKGKTKLNVFDQSEYPAFPVVEGEFFTVSSALWKLYTSNVLLAAASQDVRPQYAGIYCEIQQGRVKLTATDTYRIAHDEFDVDTQAEANLFIPADLLAEVNRLIGDERMSISWNETMIHFSTDNWTVSGWLIGNQFPTYEKVIPAPAEHPVVVDRESLRSTLQRAMLFNSGSQQAVVNLSVEEDILTVDAQGDVGSLHEELEIEPIPVSVGALFTARYLLEPLEHLSEKKVRLDLVDSRHPAVYREKDFLALVLPVRRLSEA